MEQELFERILIETTSGPNEPEVKKARDAYFEQIRDLREDDDSYERLIACFQNWYVFDRPLDNGLGTPLQAFAASAQLSARERSLLGAMAANIHSLFEVLSLKDGGLTLRDLFTGEVLRVTERRALVGLGRGDVLEARLLPVGERLVFSAGAFVLHPREARQFIQQALQNSRLRGGIPLAALMERLRALTFRFSDRFRRRVAVEKVYQDILNFSGEVNSTSASSP